MIKSEPIPANTQPRQQAEKYIPGEAGVWIFIFGDMMVFSIFFIVFLQHRSQDLPTYLTSQLTLNPHFGAANTILLLTSSLFAVLGLKSLRLNAFVVARRLFSLAALCGVSFGILKIIEYSQKILSGINLTTNEFFMFYFMYTGIHFMHVLIGLSVLAFMIHKTRSHTYTDNDRIAYESGAAFWHMVDLLWIVLFPLLYLVK